MLTNIALGLSEEMIRFQEIVKAAGGVFVGIQETLLATQPALLSFINPETEKYLVVPFNPREYDGGVLYLKVRERIFRDTEEFSNRHVSVKASDLRRISKQLLALSQELDALLERKKS
jgi:hypothetical protein